MKRKTTKNTVYLLTTVSVYLGLVLVGASPHVIARAKAGSDVQNRVLEFTSRQGDTLSGLKLTRSLDDRNGVSLPFSGSFNTFDQTDAGIISLQQTAGRSTVFSYHNDQVFTVSLLPRASI